VTKFAAVSFVLLAALGTVLSVEMHALIDRRARAEAERMGVVTTRLMFSAITAQGSAGGLPDPSRLAAQMTSIGAALHDPRLERDLLGTNAWLSDGTLVFSSNVSLVGRRLTMEPGVRLAFTGHANTTVVRDRHSSDSYLRGDGTALEVYVPVQLAQQGPPVAVAELALPYAPIEHAVAQDTLRTVSAVAIGLLLLWLALFRVVLTASRRLRNQSEMNRHLALHDTLTGLPNRVLLLDRATTALALASRSRRVTGVLMLDLDRFKEINDTLGHNYGDGLLVGVAGRLEEVLRPGDTAIRLGGDEFAILVTDLERPEEVHAVAVRVQAVLHQPFMVEDVTLDVEASIGMATSPAHGDDIDTLLRCADVAMYAAKASRSGIEMYEAGHDQHTPARLVQHGDLRRALDDGEQLRLHYQPKVSLDGQTVVGVEALLRWAHPTRGQVGPAEFIPVAEGTGLIHPLTTRTLHLGIAQARRWLDGGHRIPVAINISTRCLLDVDLPAKIRSILHQHQVPADLLRLEITESTLMADPARALNVLNELAGDGIRLSIDDFGTGFSSMSYLKRLPIDELKVDRSFVTDMTAQAADQAVVRSIVELGHNLGLHVVAEGVETLNTVDALSSLGCDVAQGYHFARPMPAEDIDGWIEQHNRRILTRRGVDTPA
jgi:diguanylate cyclase (GGDEF)-like protein